MCDCRKIMTSMFVSNCTVDGRYLKHYVAVGIWRPMTSRVPWARTIPWPTTFVLRAVRSCLFLHCQLITILQFYSSSIPSDFFEPCTPLNQSRAEWSCQRYRYLRCSSQNTPSRCSTSARKFNLDGKSKCLPNKNNLISVTGDIVAPSLKLAY